MSEQKEVEILRARRVELETESRLLNEKKDSLENCVQVLEEGIMIAELENSNEVVRNHVRGLESRVTQLEKRLAEARKKSKTVDNEKENSSETSDKSNIPNKKERSGTSENRLEAAEEIALSVEGEEDESQFAIPDDPSRKLGKQKGRRKRKFF